MAPAHVPERQQLLVCVSLPRRGGRPAAAAALAAPGAILAQGVEPPRRVPVLVQGSNPRLPGACQRLGLPRVPATGGRTRAQFGLCAQRGAHHPVQRGGYLAARAARRLQEGDGLRGPKKPGRHVLHEQPHPAAAHRPQLPRRYARPAPRRSGRGRALWGPVPRRRRRRRGRALAGRREHERARAAPDNFLLPRGVGEALLRHGRPLRRVQGLRRAAGEHVPADGRG
mmetsp:Transcript_20500/g.64768  ORF Transcript_20500/g.64768 Transcript_20500/m.64768 type:complete len:227 (+) Transcript_20500:312-992(+)